MNSILGLVFIAAGLAFNLFGCLGLVRLPDVYNRLQAATKCVTLGTCSILFGTFLLVGFTAAGMKSLLCMGFLILTSPVAAHAVARGAHRSGVKLWEKSVVDRYAEDKEGEA
ncbi:MAG: monovalent cation/H(+) antiporter subunit G [Candidatus Omnitrophica bacterium]|nr:monovalent cation/H(+) antiporter subunit G [Candidatus Omnitrophota bacterium]